MPYEGPDKAIYIQGAVHARLDQERDVVIGMRQCEWDAANAFIYRALVASTRPTDLAVMPESSDPTVRPDPGTTQYPGHIPRT